MLRRRMPTPSYTASAEDAVPGAEPSAAFATFLHSSSPAEIRCTFNEKDAPRVMFRSQECAFPTCRDVPRLFAIEDLR